MAEQDDAKSGAEDTPVAHLVNLILMDAFKRGASRIYIEPFGKNLSEAKVIGVDYAIDRWRRLRRNKLFTEYTYPQPPLDKFLRIV